MREHPRFLVLRGGAIGDFIMTLPVLQALREHWPEAHLELVGYPHIARLAVAAGLVDRLRSLDEVAMARFFADRPEFSDEQRAFISSFHVVLSYLHDPEGLVRENLLRAGARRVIYGSPRVERGHAADHLVKPLEELAVYVRDPCPRLSLQPEWLQRGRELLRERGLEGRPVALHPGSGSPSKNWPASRFVELARRLSAEGRGQPFFILGEADAAVGACVAQQAPDVPRLSDVTLVDLACALAHAKVFIGNDSGVTHVAAALGLRVVAIFGPSDPERWAPRGGHVTVLRAPDARLESISVEDVLAALGVARAQGDGKALQDFPPS